MIPGYCRTNLDAYKREEWPTAFVAVPREGEWVRAKSGKLLRVVKVTHSMAGSRPRIEVELHLICGSIAEDKRSKARDVSEPLDVERFERALQDLARGLERRRDARRYGVNCALSVLWSMRRGVNGADAIREILEEPTSTAEATPDAP